MTTAAIQPKTSASPAGPAKPAAGGTYIHASTAYLRGILTFARENYSPDRGVGHFETRPAAPSSAAPPSVSITIVSESEEERAATLKTAAAAAAGGCAVVAPGLTGLFASIAYLSGTGNAPEIHDAAKAALSVAKSAREAPA